LKPQAIIRPEGGQKLPSPFTLCKYRANVRVVDYFPHKIEDFAVGHRASELDMLSDYSGGEDTDPEEEMRIFKSGKGFAKNVWEWRFALQVEDASSKVSKERLWLMVDNHAAQGLLGLEDDATK
jgi:protection of telomeres protein 1